MTTGTALAAASGISAATRSESDATRHGADPLELRLAQLRGACELLADGFDGLDSLIAEYVCHTRGDRRTLSADVDRFLDWLQSHTDVGEEHRDLVAALRGRNAVELIAVRQRLAHVRFQELLIRTPANVFRLGTDAGLAIHLNPIHVWSQFETRALLDDEADVPATVLFFPVGESVRTIVVEPEIEALVQELKNAGPTTLCELMRRTPRHLRDACGHAIRKLAATGMIAVV